MNVRLHASLEKARRPGLVVRSSSVMSSTCLPSTPPASSATRSLAVERAAVCAWLETMPILTQRLARATRENAGAIRLAVSPTFTNRHLRLSTFLPLTSCFPIRNPRHTMLLLAAFLFSVGISDRCVSKRQRVILGPDQNRRDFRNFPARWARRRQAA